MTYTSEQTAAYRSTLLERLRDLQLQAHQQLCLATAQDQPASDIFRATRNLRDLEPEIAILKRLIYRTETKP